MNTQDFLRKHLLAPEAIDPEACAPLMLDHMREGLKGNVIDMPMIPTYLGEVRNPPLHRPVMVIDAGGTNYRCGLAEFTEGGCILTDVKKSKMPGTDVPVTWEEFIAFAADSLLPFAAKSDTVGFCFSYEADMTEDIDGIVHTIDKEVVVTGCKGKKIGESLSKALADRGFPGRRVIILNDTVAALLGGTSSIDVSGYSDFTGMICGTGINTCAPARLSEIKKIDRIGEGSMLINFESGAYSGMPRGDIDEAVDRDSLFPGEKLMEKMCSGAYVGKICREACIRAVEEGYLSDRILSGLDTITQYAGSLVDGWARGIDEYGLLAGREELEFASELSKAIFRRSARCMASVILAIMLLNDSGKEAARPMCVCAEGSLISRSKYFLPELEASLKTISEGPCGRYAKIVLGNETTLPGSAVAALLNT